MKRVVRVRLRSFGFVVSKKTLFFLVSIPAFLGLMTFLGISFLRVHEITCEMKGGQSCDEVLLAETQKMVGTPFYALQFLEMEKKTIKAIPSLKSIHFSLQPPAQVRVVGELHEPAFLIKVASGSASFVVSENGVITRESTEEDIKSLGLVAELENGALPTPGESLDSQLHLSLFKTMKQLRSTSLTVQRVLVYHARQIELELPNNQYGIIDGQFAEAQLNALQQLLNTATIKEQSAQRIDVRFARPVLR